MLKSALKAVAVAGCASPASAFTAPMRHAAEFGLVPDGSADQSRLVARAINETAIRGEVLYVPPGEYAISGVNLPSGARIAGTPGRSSLVSAGRGPILIAQQATDLAIRDMTFSGRMLGTDSLVVLDECRGLKIEDSHFTAADGTLLKLTGASGRITGSHFERASGAAIFSVDASGLTIADNLIADMGDNGILVWRSSIGEDRSIVRGNRIARIAHRSGGNGPYGNGINLYRAGRVLVSGNRIDDCAYSAVRINSGSNCQIIDNAATNIGETALYVEFDFSGAIMANNVVDVAGTGISITNFDHGGRLATVTGNIVRNLRPRRLGEDVVDSPGVGISVEADVAVTGNVVEAAPHIAIATGYGFAQRNVVVSANMIRQSGIGVAVSVAQGAGAVAVRDNIIAESSVAAIAGFDHGDRVTGELAQPGEANAHPFLDISGNMTKA